MKSALAVILMASCFQHAGAQDKTIPTPKVQDEVADAGAWTKYAGHDALKNTDFVSYTLESLVMEGQTSAKMTFFCSGGKELDSTRVSTEATIGGAFIDRATGERFTFVSLRLDDAVRTHIRFDIEGNFKAFLLNHAWFTQVMKRKQVVFQYETSQGVATTSVFQITRNGLEDAEKDCGKLP